MFAKKWNQDFVMITTQKKLKRCIYPYKGIQVNDHLMKLKKKKKIK